MKSPKPKVVMKQDPSGRWRDGAGKLAPAVFKPQPKSTTSPPDKG